MTNLESLEILKDEIKREIDSNINTFWPSLSKYEWGVEILSTSDGSHVVRVAFRVPNTEKAEWLHARVHDDWSPRDYAFLFIGLVLGELEERAWWNSLRKWFFGSGEVGSRGLAV